MSTYVHGYSISKRLKNKQNVYSIGLVTDKPKRIKVIVEYNKFKMCLILLNYI